MHSPETDAGNTLVLRPRGATVLSILVWCILGAMALEAVLAAGARGLVVLPGLALISALIWAVLWAPRVVLHAQEVEVRNLLHTYRLPFPLIRAVRLGAMLRFEVTDGPDSSRTLTAWNAPGIRRDVGALGRAGGRSGGADQQRPTTGTQRRRALSQGERLRRDQSASRSAVVRERWEAWDEASASSGSSGSTATAGRDGADVRYERTLNTPVFLVLGALLVANVLTLVL